MFRLVKHMLNRYSFGDESMDLSYYDKQDSKMVFPLLLDLYKQCCEQRAVLRNEYGKKQSAAVLRLIEETNNNSVEIYNKILKMYDEKEKKIC